MKYVTNTLAFVGLWTVLDVSMFCFGFGYTTAPVAAAAATGLIAIGMGVKGLSKTKQC